MSTPGGRRRVRKKRTRRAMSKPDSAESNNSFSFPPVNVDMTEYSPIDSEDMRRVAPIAPKSDAEDSEPPKKRLRRSSRTIVRQQRRASNSTANEEEDGESSVSSFRLRVRPLPLCTIRDGVTPYEIIALTKDDEKGSSQTDSYKRDWVPTPFLHATYHDMCKNGAEVVLSQDRDDSTNVLNEDEDNGILIPRKKTSRRKRRSPKRAKKRRRIAFPERPQSEHLLCTRHRPIRAKSTPRGRKRRRATSPSDFCDKFCGLGLATRLTPLKRPNDIDFQPACQLYGLLIPYKGSLRLVHLWIPAGTTSCLPTEDCSTDYDSHVVWIRGLCTREENPLDERDGRLPIGAIDISSSCVHNSLVSVKHMPNVPMWCYTPEHSRICLERVNESSDLHDEFMDYFRETCSSVIETEQSPSNEEETVSVDMDEDETEESLPLRRSRRWRRTSGTPSRRRPRSVTPTPTSSPGEDEDSSVYSNPSSTITVVPTHENCRPTEIKKRCRTVEISDDEDLSDGVYADRHSHLEMAERDHLRGGDDATRTWSVCSACGKWRLLPWNHRREITGGSWFCGGTRSKPRPQKCAELDHWLLFCVGHESTVRLNKLGIKTVESLVPGSELLTLLHKNGFYLTEFDKRIVKLDPSS